MTIRTAGIPGGPILCLSHSSGSADWDSAEIRYHQLGYKGPFGSTPSIVTSNESKSHLEERSNDNRFSHSRSIARTWSAAALTHGLTVAEGKGGWIAETHTFSSGMAQAFAVASVSWMVNFFTTVMVSLVTEPKPDEELRGLVWSLTDRAKASDEPWHHRAATLA
jgi:hypothetical protein